MTSVECLMYNREVHTQKTEISLEVPIVLRSSRNKVRQRQDRLTGGDAA